MEAYVPGSLSQFLNPDLEPETFNPKDLISEQPVKAASQKKKRKRDAKEATATAAAATTNKKSSKKKKGKAGEKKTDDEEPTTPLVNQGQKKKAKILKADIMTAKTEKSRERFRAFLNGADHHKDDERMARTIFVGNVPVSVKTKELSSVFSQYGKVESSRLRSFGQADPKISKRAAFAKQSFHEMRDSCNAYVVFEEEASAQKALAHNGQKMQGRTVRVDQAAPKIENERSVFVGNLSLDARDEEVRALFEECGAVEGVRLVRDKAAGVGKGFGFVLFEDVSSVRRALTFHNSVFQNRPLRVFKAVDKPKQTNSSKKASMASGGAKRRVQAKTNSKKGGGSWQGETASQKGHLNAKKKQKHADRGKKFRPPPAMGSAKKKKQPKPQNLTGKKKSGRKTGKKK